MKYYKKTRKGIFLIPSIITSLGLFSGFYSIILSISNNFSKAHIAILIAMLFDGLDGRLARLTNTQTKFGVEYDSLCDIVSFGVSPAIFLFFWGMEDIKQGFMISFIFLICAALRLARFNVQSSTPDKIYFQGLPSPVAAIFVTSFAGAMYEYNIPYNISIYIGIFFTILSSLLMVSNIRYHNFKSISSEEKVTFKFILLVIVFIIMVVAYTIEFLFIVSSSYVFFGLVKTFLDIRKKRKLKKKK